MSEANSTEETWKDISGIPGYQVSDLGRVRSMRASDVQSAADMRRSQVFQLRGEGFTFQAIGERLGIRLSLANSDYLYGRKGRLLGGPRMLKIERDRSGYASIRTRVGGKNCRYRVGLLVLQLFCSSRPLGQVCRHLNGDKMDNRLENLSWGTQRENVQDTFRHGRGNCGSRNGSAKLVEGNVREIRQMREAGTSVMSLAKIFGVSRETVYGICARISWTHVA